MKLIVSIVQFESKLHNWETAFERAEEFVQQAVLEKSKIICFPEEFLTGSLSYSKDETNLTEFLLTEFPKIYKDSFQRLSKKYPITIIAGSINEQLIDGSVVNRIYIFNKGEIIYFYDKINLFLSEKEGINQLKKTAGSELPKAIDIDGVRIGVVNCKDLYDPSLFQVLVKQGCEIVFIPAYWSANCTYYNRHKTEITKYKVGFISNTIAKTLAHARSIETGMFVAFVNCCGIIQYKNGYDQLMGKSFIVSPLEGLITKTPHLKKEVMLTTEVDLDQVKDSQFILDVPV